jgi:hypothetical protein
MTSFPRPTIRLLQVGLIVAALMLCACGAPPAISARMNDAEIRAMLARACPTASTQLQVNHGLDALKVRQASRLAYPATAGRGPVLLVRLFDDRGFWLDSEDADVKFLDISFAFSPEDHLTRTVLFRDRIRYIRGEPITSPNSPRRPLRGPLQPYPSPIPPPIDPLESAE